MKSFANDFYILKCLIPFLDNFSTKICPFMVIILYIINISLNQSIECYKNKGSDFFFPRNGILFTEVLKAIRRVNNTTGNRKIWGWILNYERKSNTKKNKLRKMKLSRYEKTVVSLQSWRKLITRGTKACNRCFISNIIRFLTYFRCYCISSTKQRSYFSIS